MHRFTPHPAAEGLRSAALILGFLLVLLGTSACQYDRESRLAEIRALQAAGQYEESIAPLRVFLTAETDNPEANYRLGVALSQTGRPSLAVWPLQKATQSEDYDIPAGLLLAATLLSTDAYEEAIRAADRVLEIEPDRVAALYTRARANISAGRPQDAIIDADRVAGLRPDDFMASTLRVAALIDLERFDEAEQVQIQQRKTATEAGDADEAAHACALLGRFYASRDRIDDATNTILECVEQYPSHTMVQQYAADLFGATGQPGKAAAVWRKAIEDSPEDIAIRAKLAKVLTDAGEIAQAEEVYKETAELFDSSQAWQMLSTFYRKTERVSQARAALEKALEKAHKEPPALRFALADMLIAEGDYERAEKIAASMQEASYRALIRGSIKLAEGEPAAALKLLEQGLRLWPNNAGARYLAGKAALQLGDLERALAEYREATRIDPEATDSARVMARIYYSMGKYTAALQFAERHIAKRPFTDEDAHVIAVRTAIELKKWEKAESILRNLNAHVEMRNIVVAENAGVRRAKVGAEAALAVVETSGLDLEDEANATALTSLTVDLIALGRGAEALERVDKALAKHPESPALLDLRARLLARAGRNAEAIAAVDKALAADPSFGPALEVKAVYAEQGGRLDEALALWDRAAATDVENAEYAYHGANVALRMGNTDDGILRLRKVVSLSPGHVASVNDLAWRLGDAGQELDRALELAERAVQLDRRAETLDTLGFVQSKRGENAAAAESFEASLVLRPEAASVRYRLAMAQAQAGDAESARSNLARALEEQSAFPEAQEARAELARLESN